MVQFNLSFCDLVPPFPSSAGYGAGWATSDDDDDGDDDDDDDDDDGVRWVKKHLILLYMHNKKPISEGSDDYETPSYVWDLILKHVSKNAVIYEPFYMNGHSGEYMKSQGYTCIHEDKDFFDENNYKYDCIISNPPFSKRKEIFEKLKQLNKPFSLIVPLQTLTNHYFKTLFTEKVQIIIPNHRIGFIKNDVWTTRADFDSIIINYKMNLPQDIIYETENIPRAPNMFTCPHCNITVKMRGKANHIKGKKHLNNEAKEN